MTGIQSKMSYAKKGALIGFFLWLAGVLSLSVSVVFYKLGLYVLEMFFGKISVFIFLFPFKIVHGGFGEGASIELGFSILLISVIATLFLYPVLGALIGYVIGAVKEKTSS